MEGKPEKKIKRTQNTLIVNSENNEGKSFTEVIKDLKTNIVPEEMGVNIKKLAQLPNGALKVQFKEQ